MVSLRSHGWSHPRANAWSVLGRSSVWGGHGWLLGRGWEVGLVVRFLRLASMEEDKRFLFSCLDFHLIIDISSRNLKGRSIHTSDFFPPGNSYPRCFSSGSWTGKGGEDKTIKGGI